jgi:hypothetical protein
MRVAIIGAGWYGCHLATVMRRVGIEFRILERESAPFLHASSNNQNRLHLGFHYARSFDTRRMCKENYERFLKSYGEIVDDIDENYYLVSKDSFLDAETYRHIFAYEGYDIVPISDNCEFRHSQLLFRCNERVINHKRAAAHFKSLFGDSIEYGCTVTPNLLEQLSSEYDYVFDCTNNMMGLVKTGFFYERTLSLIYKRHDKHVRGLTVVDGDFVSMYPYDVEQQLYTLTHVKHTPLVRSDSLTEVRESDACVTPELIRKFEEGYEQYEPDFRKHFEYVGSFTSFKAKQRAASDTRDLSSHINGNIISFICGKITGIFSMEDYVLTTLLRGADNASR